MSKELLEQVIKDGVEDNLNTFFLDISDSYRELDDSLPDYDNEQFTGFKAIGEINFSPTEKLVVVTANVLTDLTERSGKKDQYEKARKILKFYQRYDAGIFVFSDAEGNFRLSLVYGTPDATRTVWSNFRRFTYYASPGLTNKTFLSQVGECRFTGLDIVKDAFSVEKVTKDFYKKIADWYFWAVQQVSFPRNVESETNGKNNAIIRLITRLIFIWFMKERGLVSPQLFDQTKTASLLKSLKPDETTYYKAILQNLFFATLNTKMEDRKFRFNRSYQGKNTDYMDHGIYRYETYFKNQEDMLDIFKDIPFLNGGLFDCLDWPAKEMGTDTEVRFDGFTDKEVGLKIPNYLFFSNGDVEADLNDEYGSKGKKYKVQGILDILSSYNFTIDENDPNDQEVALDPELLGKVFENLLASFNPETATTARKATGSYYTPREIVDYMVTQSLKQYYKTHLGDIIGIDDKLERLFSPAEEDHANPFNEADTRRIVQLTDDLRIVDPAVGSGAFPMGILNKLVFILGKVDKDNVLWKQAQLKVIDKLPDPVFKQQARKQLETRFEEKNANYGRKLYLIEKCIYGVDIQQTAIEIAKLRFFIALLVEETIDKNKPNWEIEPLPNLDFKLMQGNSLISEFMGIDFDAADKLNTNIKMNMDEMDGLIAEFQVKKGEFQNTADWSAKKALKAEIESLINRIFEGKLKTHHAEYFMKREAIKQKYSFITDVQQRNEYTQKDIATLSKNYQVNPEAVEKQLKEFTSGFKIRPFFAWKLYFSEVFHEKGGFDVVIANPPYGYRDVLTPEEKEHFRKVEKIEFSSGDSAELFSKKGFDKLVIDRGILTFIIPKKSLYGDAWDGFRKDYWKKYKLTFLLDVSKAFENVLFEENVFGLVKTKGISEPIDLCYLTKSDTIFKFATAFKEDIFMDNGTVQIYKMLFSNNLFEKIHSQSAREKLATGDLGLAIGTDFFSDTPREYKLLKGIDIDRWVVRNNRYLANKHKLKWSDAKRFLKPKVISQVLVAHIENPEPHIKVTACYDGEGIIITNTLTSFKIDDTIQPLFWLAYLNSSFTSWYAYNFIYSRAIRTMHFYSFYIEQLPIARKVIDNIDLQQPFVEVVNKILNITKEKDYLSNPVKQAQVKDLEAQIDRMVYDLYDLTPEEKAVVEGNLHATKQVKNKANEVYEVSSNHENQDVQFQTEQSKAEQQDEPTDKLSFILTEFLTQRNIEYIDKRPQGGVLWMIGENELKPIISELKAKGFNFTYSPHGGKASGFRSAWFSATKG